MGVQNEYLMSLQRNWFLHKTPKWTVFNLYGQHFLRKEGKWFFLFSKLKQKKKCWATSYQKQIHTDEQIQYLGKTQLSHPWGWGLDPHPQHCQGAQQAGGLPNNSSNGVLLWELLLARQEVSYPWGGFPSSPSDWLTWGSGRWPPCFKVGYAPV